MIDVILHIGRHKSGTSALQNFFIHNKKFLSEKGYCYPEKFLRGAGHHLLAEPLSNRNIKGLSENELEFNINELAISLDTCLQDDKVYIISSEAFQNVPPKVVRKIFPSSRYNVTVFCYFREQVAYLASAYNQKIHATFYDQDIIDFERNVFSADYFNFAKGWAKYFPSFKFGVYERDQLVGSDIVEDFFSKLGHCDLSGCVFPAINNPSLSNELLAYKLQINRLINQNSATLVGTKSQLYRYFSEKASVQLKDKFILDEKISVRVEEKYKCVNEQFFENFLPGSSFKKYHSKQDSVVRSVDLKLLKEFVPQDIVRFKDFDANEY